MRPVAQATDRVAYLSCGGYYTMSFILATCRIIYYPMDVHTKLRNCRPGIAIPVLYHVFHSCDTSHCILPHGRSRKVKESPPRRGDSCTLRPECGDVYAPSERHLCYTLRRSCSYPVAICPMPSTVYAFLQLSATFYLSAIAIYRMPHCPI